MTAIPVWLTGRHVTACALIPQTVAANGTLSAGASSSLVGSLDGIEIDSTPEEEEISPMTTTRRNPVNIKEGTRFTVTEILKSNGTNLLAAAATAADYFQITLTRGGQSWSAYVKRGAYTESLQRGKSTASLTLETVDISGTNPTYS